MCIWFLQALVSSVKGQGVTIESCHLLPLSNPFPPIIRSSPPSFLLPDAVRSNERLSSEQARELSPGAGRETHALLCWTGTPRGPGSKHPESGVSGWRDFLSLSSCSTAPVCSIIQAGLNPSSLYPPHSFSVHPSISPSLSHINSLCLSCPHLFTMALWPTVFPVFLSLLFCHFDLVHTLVFFSKLFF